MELTVERTSVSQTHSAFLGEKDHLALDAYHSVCCAVATCSRTSPSEGQWAERDATGWVDVSWIEDQWEAWQSHCQFLMGSLCFWCVVSPFRWNHHPGPWGRFREQISISYPDNTNKCVLFEGWVQKALPTVWIPHLMTQLSQVNGLGPGCPPIFAALFFLQRSETGQCTVGPRGPLQTGRLRDVQGGDLQRGHHGHLLRHARLYCSGGECALCLSGFGNPDSPAAPSETLQLVGGVESWHLQTPLWLLGWMMAENVLGSSQYKFKSKRVL